MYWHPSFWDLLSIFSVYSLIHTVQSTSRGRPEVSIRWLGRFDFRIFLTFSYFLSELTMRKSFDNLTSKRPRLVSRTVHISHAERSRHSNKAFSIYNNGFLSNSIYTVEGYPSLLLSLQCSKWNRQRVRLNECLMWFFGK